MNPDFDVDIMTDSCWALSYIFERNVVGIEGICLESGIIERAIALMQDVKLSTVFPVLRIIGSITTCTS
jgi:hypothetical protein